MEIASGPQFSCLAMRDLTHGLLLGLLRRRIYGRHSQVRGYIKSNPVDSPATVTNQNQEERCLQKTSQALVSVLK